ncbi:MAG: hypothetical protein IT204_05405 [Fimbriimonadaceae bacterium]|nr:hypothetical protein [Fimbriimonadaceae bacterium]
MLWSEVLESLGARQLVEGADFEVQSVAAADLLSDILATDKEQFMILTGQISPQAIRTALTVGALGVVVVRGKQPPPETVGLAQNYGVPLAVTDLKMFEACVAVGARLWSSASSKNSSTV